jgi:hypothetical protein
MSGQHPVGHLSVLQQIFDEDTVNLINALCAQDIVGAGK